MNDLEFWSIKQLRTAFHSPQKVTESIPAKRSSVRIREILKRIVGRLGFGKSVN